MRKFRLKLHNCPEPGLALLRSVDEFGRNIQRPIVVSDQSGVIRARQLPSLRTRMSLTKIAEQRLLRKFGCRALISSSLEQLSYCPERQSPGRLETLRFPPHCDV